MTGAGENHALGVGTQGARGESPTPLHPIPRETSQTSRLRAGEGHSPVSNGEGDKKDGEQLLPTIPLTPHSTLGAGTLTVPISRRIS